MAGHSFQGGITSGPVKSLLTRCTVGRPQVYPPLFLLPTLLPLQSTRNASHLTEKSSSRPARGPGARLGAKRGACEPVVTGNIIFRQRGTNWHAGEGCARGRDHTIFAMRKGYVTYYREKWKNIVGERKFIGVVLESHHTLPRPPTMKTPRRLGMVGRDRDMVKESEAVGEQAESKIATPGSVDGSNTAPQESTLPKRTNAQRTRIPDSSLMMKPGYQYRESNTSIGRVADRMGITFKPYDRKFKTHLWTSKLGGRSKFLKLKAKREAKGLSKRSKGSKSAQGKKAKKGRK